MKTIPPATVVYDGKCAFCRNSVAWFQKRAMPGAIEFLPAQSPERHERYPWLTDEQCNAAMQLVLADGRTLSGGDALPQLFARLRGWHCLAWLMSVLRLLHVTGPVYRWIARHRDRLPVIRDS